MDKKKKKQPSEWSKTGSFMHKPDRGWIHPDGQIKPDAGVCYGVRVYILFIFYTKINVKNQILPSYTQNLQLYTMETKCYFIRYKSVCIWT